AISTAPLVAVRGRGVPLRYKDYRRDGRARSRAMPPAPGEFIRPSLPRVPPRGFHRIRHYGLLASAGCKANIVRARELIAVRVPPDPRTEDDNTDQAGAATDHLPPCPCCGGRMIIVEVFERGAAPRGPPSPRGAVRTATP